MSLSPETLDALEAEGLRLETEARKWQQAAAAIREVVALYRADFLKKEEKEEVPAAIPVANQLHTPESPASRSQRNLYFANPEKVAQAKPRYEAGESLPSIGKAVGISRNTVLAWAKRFGWERPFRRSITEPPIITDAGEINQQVATPEAGNISGTDARTEVVTSERSESPQLSQGQAVDLDETPDKKPVDPLTLVPTPPAEQKWKGQRSAYRGNAEQRERAKQLYLESKEWPAYRTIGEAVGVSGATIRRWSEAEQWDRLRPKETTEEPGVEEPEGDDGPPTRDAVRAAKEAEAAELYESGKSVEEIAVAVGVCKATVFNWKRMGGWDRGKSHADRQIDSWERRQKTEIRNIEIAQSALFADSPLHPKGESTDESASIDGDDSAKENPGLAYLRSDPPPPCFLPGSEPGWILLPHRLPE